MTTRRQFVQKAALGAAGLTLGAKSYSRILGANDRVRVGIVGYSDRFRQSLYPAFTGLSKELNFEFTALSDLWSLRREEADKFFKAKGITLRLRLMQENTWNSGYSGHILPGSLVSGWHTRSIPFTGSQSLLTRAASQQTAVYTCGRTAAQTSIQ
jgi:hypothetical protein